MNLKVTVSVAVALLSGLPGIALAETEAPSNDDRASAAAISQLPFAETVNLRGATLEINEIRPSCSGITRTVWYELSASEDSRLATEVSSTFPSVAAVFDGSSMEEVVCVRGTAQLAIEFDAVGGRQYLVQLGAASNRTGVADIRIEPARWQEKELLHRSFDYRSQDQNLPILTLKGHPRSTDPDMYDIMIAINQGQTRTAGVRTYGLVTQEIDLELLRIPGSTTSIEVVATARYDSSQHVCAIDDGGRNCIVGTPVKDLSWVTGGEGSKAELVFSVRAVRNNQVLAQRTVTVPFAGQAGGVGP